jgi:hypothetical protein
MSDIDFDELDKAVNTLMGDVPKVEPVKTDDIKTLTINSTLSDDTPPSLAKLDSTLAAVNGVTTLPTQASAANRMTRPSSASLASRRTGRFMDVVHPSADMKTANKIPSRQGVSIEPARQLPSEKPSDQSDEQPVVTVSPDSYKDLTVSDVAPADHSSTTNDWPDPIEMSGYETEVAKNSSSVEHEEQASTPAEMPDEQIDTPAYEDPQPLTSPFITDAKVEKRPLGGTPVEEPGRAPVLGALASEDEAAGAADPADQLPATPAAAEVQLPPELQSDLMAIEAAGEQPMNMASPASEAAPAVDTKAMTEPTPAPVQASESATVSGPTSIPQQYHEAPSTSDESNGSIYDTASYHQPLAHPVKAKSGWLWIIWILLLLIVGGGGAVALYFVGII